MKTEVWTIFFRYLRLVDLVEVSAVCKEFYSLVNELLTYVNRLQDFQNLFCDKVRLRESYNKLFQLFYYAVKYDLFTELPIESIYGLRQELFYRLYYSILPFRVLCHIWCCCNPTTPNSTCISCDGLLS